MPKFNLFDEHGIRPDHQVHVFGTTNLLTDVTVVTPAQPNAIAAREHGKCAKYQLPDYLQDGFEFQPLVFDVYGALGDRAQDVLNRCATLHIANKGFFPTRDAFLRYYGQMLTVSLVTANLAVYTKYLEAVLPCSAGPGILADYPAIPEPFD